MYRQIPTRPTLHIALRASCNLYTLCFYARSLLRVSSAPDIRRTSATEGTKAHAVRDRRPACRRRGRPVLIKCTFLARRGTLISFARERAPVVDEGAPLSLSLSPGKNLSTTSPIRLTAKRATTAGKRGGEKGETDTNNGPLLPRIYLCHSVTKQVNSENDPDDKSFAPDAGSITALHHYLVALPGERRGGGGGSIIDVRLCVFPTFITTLQLPWNYVHPRAPIDLTGGILLYS